MKTWIKNTLIAALGASVVLGGLAVASPGRMGMACGMHGGAMSEADTAKMRERMIERASSELSLDATQRQHLVSLAGTLHEQRQTMMPAGTSPREQLSALIAGERFDASRAQSLVLEKTEALRNASPSVIAAAATFYDSLRPEQQQKLREFMAQGRHGGWRS
jgi:Spy/CpxP family protein refolding chaperone